MERDLGTFTTISANRGLPRRPSPGSRGGPIDSAVSGFDPLAVHVRRQRDLTDHPTLGIDRGELRQGGARLQIVLVSLTRSASR